MNDKDLNTLFNSSLVFDHLIKNKSSLTAYLEDGSKLSGRLLGWDPQYLIILYGKTLQVVPAGKLLRLQAELDNTQTVPEPPAIPEATKPKFNLEPMESTSLKDQIMAAKPQNTDIDSPPAKDRLDHLVKNL
jgi:hypothetical protein